MGELDTSLYTGPLEGLRVVDVDTHVTEKHDLWTSRVPEKMKSLVPHVVKDADGIESWVFNGEDVMHKPAGTSSVIRKDGSRKGFWEGDIQNTMLIEEISEASYDARARVDVMNQMGIWAQIVYPNLAGFGANRFAKLPDLELAAQIISIYNDAMSEFQADSNGRIFPMGLVPYWDIDKAVKEVTRIPSELKLHGITMCSEPQDGGYPDLINTHWYPLWEVCTAYDIPVNFHVGASDFGLEQFVAGAWPSNDRYRRYVIGCSLLELHNARILANLLTSTLLDRFPKINWVLVESGIGWIPYVLERLEWQLMDKPPDGVDESQVQFASPTEQLRKHVYNCFWFEEEAPAHSLERIGFDHVLFETDYPHPTCLYLDDGPSLGPVERGLKVLESWGPEVQRKVMGENAAQLYNLSIPAI